jgi:hypothetical protein
MRHVPPSRRLTINGLHADRSPKIEFRIVIIGTLLEAHWRIAGKVFLRNVSGLVLNYVVVQRRRSYCSLRRTSDSFTFTTASTWLWTAPLLSPSSHPCFQLLMATHLWHENEIHYHVNSVAPSISWCLYSLHGGSSLRELMMTCSIAYILRGCKVVYGCVVGLSI